MTEKKIKNLTLDPENWDEIRALGHQMIDDLVDYWKGIREEPVWKPIPAAVKSTFETPIPKTGKAPTEVYQEFKDTIFAYNKGNLHPRFFAWIQGTGNPMGVWGDLLASGMNPNVTIGEHAPLYVDKQVVNWCKAMMNFPEDA